MARLGTAGDTREVGPDEMNRRRGARPIPAGWYRVALTQDRAETKDWGLGLSMEFAILDGENAGQKLFDYLCVEHHRSEKAQHIARIKLRELATAAGHRTPENVESTDSLYKRPVMAEVYRADEETRYAEEDGKRPRIGQFLSVARWKQEHESSLPDEPRNTSPAATRPDPSSWADEEIPF